MKRYILLILGVLFISQSVLTQTTTIILRPAGDLGKDAYIESRRSDTNFGDLFDLPAISWTFQGIPVDARGLIDFDLSGIPENAVIDSALLSLYSYESPINGSHSTLSGSNESVLSRIITSWDESTVTWDNQPSTTTQNQVFLPESTDSIQDYLDIDVTNLVQDMIYDNDNSYGFLLKLVTEQYYRRMLFASSDNADTTLHPKLTITFTEIQSDSCIVLKPAGDLGKDAYIESRRSDTNFGDLFDLPAISWTFQGIPVDARGLIDFDLSGIPDNATVDLALLSLYSYDSPINGSHSTLSGSNESVLSRIVTSWDESTVTWENQPLTTSQNQVFLAESTSPIQDYINIDVTNLVQDMIDNTDSYGFLLQLVTEQYYRRMLFASSDNADSTLHPRLEVCYSNPISITEGNDNDLGFNVFPNPASDFITIDLRNFNQEFVSIVVINSLGQITKHISDGQSAVTIDVSNYSKGIYFVKVYFDNFVSIKKIIIE